MGISSAGLSLSQNSQTLNELKYGFAQGCKEKQSRNIQGVYIIEEYISSMCECTANRIADTLSLDTKFSQALKNQDYYLISDLIKKMPPDFTKQIQFSCAESSLKRFGNLSNIFVTSQSEAANGATRKKNGGEIAIKQQIYQSCYAMESKQKNNAKELCVCVASEAYNKITIISLFNGDSKPIMEGAKICKENIK